MVFLVEDVVEKRANNKNDMEFCKLMKEWVTMKIVERGRNGRESGEGENER